MNSFESYRQKTLQKLVAFLAGQVRDADSLTQILNNQSSQRTLTGFEQYRNNPVGFAQDVLGITLTPLAARAAESLLTPPYRVLMPSANSMGKTCLQAVVAIWWYSTRRPAIVISTAPKLAQLRDLLWKEIRTQVSRAKQPLPIPFNGPRSLRAERSPDDFMVGVTARDDTSFQGHHGANKLFLFDEAIGVEPQFWTATRTMFAPESGDAWLCAFNPTDLSTAAYREYQAAVRSSSVTGGWHVVHMSAVDHPNINAELRGEEPPVPHAMRLGMFEDLLHSWSNLLTEESDHRATDLHWPPPWAAEYIAKSGRKPRWYRPGPLAEARLFARFPSQSAYAVWSDGDWQAACRIGLQPLPIPTQVLPEIGIDVARYGDDNTAFHVRHGPCSLHHEEFNGQSLDQTIGRAKQLAKQYAELVTKKRPRPVRATEIPIKVDDSGVGGGVTDMLLADGYCVAGVNAGTLAVDSEAYPLRRDELWFHVASEARLGQLDLSRLDAETLERLKTQALAIKYKLNSKGQRVVNPKEKSKEEIGTSPDGMDAVNLAYAFVDGLAGGANDMPRVGNKKSR